MKELAVSTYTALGRQSLPSALRTLADAGREDIELLAAPPHVDLENVVSAVAGLVPVLRQTGQRVTSVAPSGVDANLASTHAGMRRWSRQQFIGAIRLAAGLGAPYAVVHPGRRHPLRPPPMEQLVERVLEGLDVVAREAESEGVRVLLENVPSGLIDTASECADVVSALSNRIGLCYDVANGHMVEDAPQALAHLSVQPELVHVSDTRRDRWLHEPLGTAEVRWDSVAEALSGRAYTGMVVLETLHEGDYVSGFARDERVWLSAVDRAAAQ